MSHIAFSISDYTLQPWHINGLILVILLLTLWAIRRIHVWYRVDDSEQALHNQKELTPAMFFQVRKRSMKSFKQASTRQSFAFTGVYILRNKTQDRYYVGQGKNVLDRVNQHLTGRGNGEVYADYRNGDEWTIQLINFDDTHFNTLNELERHMIRAHDAYFNGYNKTRGNR